MTRMLYSRNIFQLFQKISIVLLLAVIMSCVPQSTPPGLNTTNSTKSSGEVPAPYKDPSFPFTSIFIQEGSLQTPASFSVPLNFSDSFLIRGAALSQFLRTVPNTTQICLVGKYSYIPGQDRFLVLSAKSTSFTDLVKKTTEFYLKVEPQNDQANQNDCLSYNLNNSLFSTAKSPSVHYSLSQLCTNCNSTVTSGGLKLYLLNGEQVPNLNLSLLTLTISASTTSAGNMCYDSSSCKASGFDCCLEGQCIKDGAVRPSALTQPGFAVAQEDVRLNPDRFVVYPQYYFVCPNRPASTGGTSGGSQVDPNYAASIRLMELNYLYQCLNKIDGEFSHCTIKFSQASKKINAAQSFSALSDDITFTTVNPNYISTPSSPTDYSNNIVKILYGGETLFEAGKKPLGTNGSFVNGSANDNLIKAQEVLITKTLPATAPDDNLYLTYKVDGSCQKVGATLAKCTKSFVQGSSSPLNTTWHDSTKLFNFPEYADFSSSGSIILKISGVIIPEDPTTWTRYTNPNRIIFNTSYPLYQNQTIDVTYFVTSQADKLIASKSAAQDQVNAMCTCGASGNCNLRPLYDKTNVLVNFECTYPTTTSTEPPVNQTVFVSNKNTPHRYFDLNGVNYDENYGSALPQELTAFAYTNNDVLKPNNLNVVPTGFNEIYGSFSQSSSQAAKPAKLVKVKKDKVYDIFVNSGIFSSCITCGSDYYSSLQKIFPDSFSSQGGGYTPDYLASRRQTNASVYRGDDLLYGRACFVPTTMIPWTHLSSGTPTDQRRTRLAGQHFLMANGYARDWYGFDYGSLIGSFDGVQWFSIGNQRRIKASTGKLFLAVNAYFGDLSSESNYSVSISETTPYSSEIPDHDTKTSGAECQKAHFCSNDNDCFRNLGYDYTCQNVSSLITAWPQFDPNASEVVGSLTKSLTSLVGGTNGQAKRCVYRGRGAPCKTDLTNITSSFNGSGVTGTLACSPNNYCQSLTGTNSNRFNDRITRFASTPLAQNLAAVDTNLSDTFGLGARIIGRPYQYYGNKSVPTQALTSLSTNQVNAVCLPGKEITSATKSFDLNLLAPANRTDSSDKILGVGPTMSGTQNLKYLNACPATDDQGVLVQNYNYDLGTDAINKWTITQNLSTNLLNSTPLINQNIYSSANGNQVTKVGYQKNACLRAPGASCFSDMECAPSDLIASKVKSSDLSALLNPAEKKFWEEELVCGNPDFKYVNGGAVNPDFSIKNNVCCREFGKTISVATQSDSSSHAWCDTSTSTVKVAGVNSNIGSFDRYSRVHSGYDKMTCNRLEISSNKKFALSIAAPDAISRLQQILGQYETLDTINKRTCCTQHWVRSFDKNNAGGGHKWGREKVQTIDKAVFREISWYGQDTSLGISDNNFECDINNENYNTSACEVRNFTDAEADNYLQWFGSLELIGIPQVAIKTNRQIFRTVDSNQNDVEVLKLPIFKTIQAEGPSYPADFNDGAPDGTYFSGTSYNKLFASDTTLKKVFSEDEFNCCIPSGKEVPSTTTANQCCTGSLANNTGKLRCCLPDFTDVTVYLNRYVSSEGRGLPASAYDEKTGYIKDAGQVGFMATQKSLCCSGKTMTGVAIWNLSVPVTGGSYLPPGTPGGTSRRFNYRTDAVDNNPHTGAIGSYYDAGVRWNNHVYCVPADMTEPVKSP
jgi:hypothetical protein